MRTSRSELPPSRPLSPRGRCALLRRLGRTLLGWVPAAWLIAPQLAPALEPTADLRQFNVRTWSRQNGLPVNGVKAIAQTADGYIWLGTSIGLLRFDGVHFKSFELVGQPGVRDGNVNTLTAAKQGGLWVGLGAGFGFHDGQTFSLPPKPAADRFVRAVRSIVELSDGTLWLGTERAAARLAPNGDCFEALASSETVTFDVMRAVQDSHGRIWFGTARHGVFSWHDEKLTPFPDQELARSIVSAIAEDHTGDLWFGTASGLVRYRAGSARSETLLAGEAVQTLFVDRHGTLWIGTTGSGLFRYRHDTGLSQPFKDAQGLADVSVTAIAEDREGSLWIGTRTGLTQLSDVKFPTLAPFDSLAVPDVISAGASRRGGIWLASQAGITYFDGTARTYGVEAGLPNVHVKRVFEARNGDLYAVSGLTSLAILREGKTIAVHSGKTLIVGMAEDAHGVVVTVGGKLHRATPDGLAPYEFRSGAAPDLGWALNLDASRDGSLWVSTVNGLFRVKDGAFEHWSTQHGFLTPAIFGVCEDPDGVLWTAKPDGIARFKDGRAVPITAADGLFSNNIYSIVADDAGELWIDSQQGIFRVSRRMLNDFADGKIARIECTRFDGPESVRPADKTVQERVGCRSIDGRIWFPSSRGVVVIDPSHVATNRVAPPVHVDQIRVNGKELSPGVSRVAPGRRDVEFEFTGLSFIAPQNMAFRYQLEGYDRDWIEGRNRRVATYTNLPPGRYTFHVTAANADGVWNETGARRSIELLPYFYQTTWFAALMGATACAALGGLFVVRSRRVQQRQLHLEEARDRLETEVGLRTAQLANSNASLQEEVKRHEATGAQLQRRTDALQAEIEERKRMEREMERIHRQLIDASRQAGMAEVATNVLHNVGNVLNSVNVSATMVLDQLRASKTSSLSKLSALIGEHRGDLANFLTNDPRGRAIPGYLGSLAEAVGHEQATTLAELEQLRRHIEHIKDIVSMQQSYAKLSGVTETVALSQLVDDALRMNAGALDRHGLTLVREFEADVTISTERHKVLQILVNLIRNAKYACDESGRADKLLRLRISVEDGHAVVSVIDNGVGIPAENLTRIFNHGFTTRKEGHGFGLHSGALAAKELDGSLVVHSDGPGRGATFQLRLPLNVAATTTAP